MGLEILNMNAPKSAPIIGIDLGTTFSLAAYVRDNETILIRDETGDARIPSAIGFGADGSVTIGKEARRRAIEDPQHTAYSIKRLIGKSLAELSDELKFVPYQVVERDAGNGRKVLHVRMGDRELTPEELSALILREVASRASEHLGITVEKAVVTVPAYFDESQRQATRDAGRIAGLDVVRIVNEPTAAALAYGLQKRTTGKIAVYDFGGGTFDCSILQLQDGVFKVLSTHGDTHLGGDDIDQALMRHFEPLLVATLPAGKSVDAALRQRLRDACETLKFELSANESAVLQVRHEGQSIDYRAEFTRAELNAIVDRLIDRSLACCKAALKDAGLRTTEIDEIVLVGGSSRIPRVHDRVGEFFGKRPHSELNPDEVVAMGAAVQASILSGELRQLLLLDITPLSLGIEVMGAAVSKLIPRNSTIPAQASERFTTFVDNQTGVDIHVLQGEREMAADCRSLGKFKLTGIPPMPAGMARIDVTFLIDANGMLQVSAKEQSSGKHASIEIQPSHGLARDEVERMIRESVESAQRDFTTRRLVELRLQAETNLRLTIKSLANRGHELAEDQRKAIEAALANVEIARKVDDVQSLQKSLDDLDEATHPLAELLMNVFLEKEVVNKKLDDLV